MSIEPGLFSKLVNTAVANHSLEFINQCDHEPIRIPGSIQRHGFLLLLDEQDQSIVAASENTEQFLEVPLGLILGASVEMVFEREVLGALRAVSGTVESAGILTYLGSFPMRGRLFSVVSHLVGSQRVVEFELLDRLISPDLNNQVFTNFVSKLSHLRTEEEICQALTLQIRQLTHFNRVMLYRFDESGHGTVLSESNDGTLPSYLDLRFPASDIPQQARDLYVMNTVRIIPDATYTPSVLHGAGKKSVSGLDLSMSILRSVSPAHLEYMRNMGTMSSMSLSIICNGRLWGLVSGHHAGSHMVPYLVRSSCDLLTKLVSTQLTSSRTAADLGKRVHFHAVQRRILTQMAADKGYLVALADQMENVIQVTDAEGAALLIDGDLSVFGKSPRESHIRRLAEWLDDKPEVEVFETRHLASHVDWASDFTDLASGLLAVRIPASPRSYLLWFKPEVIQTVQWAGKPVAKGSHQQALHPRKSFEAWKEKVRATSEPWAETEIESASDFRAAMMAINFKQTKEAMEIGEARFLQLTEALPHPVWTTDELGELTYVNQRWIDQGRRPVGCWYEQDTMIAGEQKRCAQAWETAVAYGTGFDLEVRFRVEPDASDRWELMRAIPYLRSDGTRAGWVGTCTDLTERKHREASLQITEKLAVTGRMTSVIAHEINNPLEAIANLLYLLNDSVKDDSVARNYIGLAESELQRISGITKQTLRWAKESTLKAEHGTAHTIFHDVCKLLAGKIKSRQVVVTVEDMFDTPVFGVISQLAQVLMNLVANAVQAVPLGGRIWLSSRSDHEMVQMIVRDDGQGMSKETLSNLFKPYYTTKGDLGNGLGLYISQEIVERHGGRMSVQSQLGEGTTISVCLPKIT